MGNLHRPKRSEEATAWACWSLVRQAARDWLEMYGDPFIGDELATSKNPFLPLAESAFLEELNEWRELHPPEISGDDSQNRGFWLYRLWAGDGRLLYVGVTRNPRARLKAHKHKWGAIIESCTWEERTDAGDMLEAEARAISTEHPALNIDHPPVSEDIVNDA